MEPEVLLLDEPMAGMNLEEKEDMSRFVLDVNNHYGTTIALIEHDMGVVMDISDHIIVLDQGEKIAEGKLKEYYAPFCLLEQPYIREPKMTVGQLIQEKIAVIKENIVVRRFARFEVGSGNESSATD